MNLQPDTGTTNISDDQELAKVLAGVNGGPTVDDTAADVDYEETSTAPEPVAIAPEPIAINPLPIAANPVPSRDDLEGVKMEAINELRPLIDKLDLPPEEKFDTYLLLIRCTDDKELVPQHMKLRNLSPMMRDVRWLFSTSSKKSITFRAKHRATRRVPTTFHSLLQT